MQSNMPTFEDLMQPTIDALKAMGGYGTIIDINNAVQDKMHYSDDVMSIMHGQYNKEVFYRMAWTRTYLKKAGYIDNPAKGFWILTDKGKESNEINPKDISKQVRDDVSQGEIDNDLFIDVEGEDSPHSDMYPIDSLLIRTAPRTIHEVCRRIDKQQYIMNPDFQRDFVWSLDKQSRLIESIILRIPLPVFYLSEEKNGKIVVVDGLQRFTTIKRFIDDEFKLDHEGLDKSLKGKKFSELEPKLQTRIEDTNLMLYLIDEKVPEGTRLDIFERVNNGTPLTRQQMRNCLYVGSATRLLKRISENEFFLTATGRSLDSKSMRDRELINRFMAFYIIGHEEYKGYMDDFLANSLKRINQMSATELDNLEKGFLLSMENNYKVFGAHAFRKSLGQKKRSVINVSIFDTMSVLMAKINKKVAISHHEKMQNIFLNLLENQDFRSAITISTNSTVNVKRRFEIVYDAYKDYINV